MSVAQSKNSSEIKKIIYEDPGEWVGVKDDPGSGFTGFKNTGTTNTVTVKFKDGSPDQTHSIPTNGTVLFGGGFVHFSA